MADHQPGQKPISSSKPESFGEILRTNVETPSKVTSPTDNEPSNNSNLDSIQKPEKGDEDYDTEASTESEGTVLGDNFYPLHNAGDEPNIDTSHQLSRELTPNTCDFRAKQLEELLYTSFVAEVDESEDIPSPAGELLADLRLYKYFVNVLERWSTTAPDDTERAFWTTKLVDLKELFETAEKKWNEWDTEENWRTLDNVWRVLAEESRNRIDNDDFRTSFSFESWFRVVATHRGFLKVLKGYGET
ncbi:MAG: hypothetical protein Q9181_007445 [Wetmoreana brouardii]